MITGYSDRINHALSYAAKHHDRQVRIGTRLPYATQPGNVAIILTRYGRSDDAVVAGILHNVVADHLVSGLNREQLDDRLVHKFGVAAIEILLPILERRVNDNGVELSLEERREDLLQRLPGAQEDSLWVCAADRLHVCASLLADLRRSEFREAVWGRQKMGRDSFLSWHGTVFRAMGQRSPAEPILSELGAVLKELELLPR
jgi:(p)ppGpp synthase/HD superfamily hydrolase